MKAIMRDEREMKDSGIEWIGTIPKHWSVMGFKKCIDNIVDYRGKTPEKVDSGRLLITAKNIKDGKINYGISQEFVKDEEFDKIMHRGIVNIGDVLFTTEAPLGQVANADRTDFALAQRIIKFSSKPDMMNNYFLKYWILSFGFQENLKRFATGSTATGIKASKLGMLKALVPTIDEQENIVIYLDDHCSKIDAIIAEAKASIEEYKDLKQAVIYEAVTKGLDKNVEMKDSGIEWIGTIPYQWHLEKINHIGVTSSGSTPARDKEDEYFANADISWIKTLDLNDGHVKYSSEKITLEALNSSSCSLMPVGTVCVAMYGGAGTIGKSGILDFECATNQAICSIICDREKQVGRYLQYQLQAMRSYWMKYAVGTRKDPNISQQTVAQMKVLVPPISTQRLIADYLDDKIIDLESLISEKQALIEDLESYKKSLIYEVVTGKRKVVE